MTDAEEASAADAPRRPAQDRGFVGWRPSLGAYLVGLNLFILCLLFPTLLLLHLREDAAFRDAQVERTVTLVRAALERRASSLARALSLSAGQALAGYDFAFAQHMLQTVVEGDPEIRYCFVMDLDLRVLAHSDPALIGLRLHSRTDLKARGILRQGFPERSEGETAPHSVRFLEPDPGDSAPKGRILEAIAPVYSGAMLAGALRCGYSLQGLDAEIRILREEWGARMAVARRQLLTLAGGFFVAGLAVSLFLTRRLTRALSLLAAGARRVADGDLSHRVGGIGLACAEHAGLAAAFDHMTETLQESRRLLDEHSRSLERQVEERTRELREAQASLVQQAHEAGLAEMAVGTLHNIGNAVTPAKVAAANLLKRLRRPILPQQIAAAAGELGRAVVTHPGLSSDEQTRLAGILDLLPKTVEDELSGLAQEMEAIRSAQEHVEGILGLQMRYARLVGEAEEVDVARVVDDSLRMMEGALSKHSIRVERHIGPTPAVRMAAPKLMQIVVNLIRNAVEAMEAPGANDRTLTITLGTDPAYQGHAVLSVRDTGVGFSAEQEKSLFLFGYTTKARGSGFGLHASANDLIAHQGSISARSDGRGKGAEFVIRVPASGNPLPPDASEVHPQGSDADKDRHG